MKPSLLTAIATVLLSESDRTRDSNRIRDSIPKNEYRMIAIDPGVDSGSFGGIPFTINENDKIIVDTEVVGIASRSLPPLEPHPYGTIELNGRVGSNIALEYKTYGGKLPPWTYTRDSKFNNKKSVSKAHKRKLKKIAEASRKRNRK